MKPALQNQTDILSFKIFQEAVKYLAEKVEMNHFKQPDIKQFGNQSHL